MNKRIKALMEEAGIYDFVVESMGINEEMEKFAELIVQECMSVCADNACRAGGLNTQVGEDLYLASNLIREHFGVTE